MVKKFCVKCKDEFYAIKHSSKICDICKKTIKCCISKCNKNIFNIDRELCRKHDRLFLLNKDEGYELKYCVICNKKFKPSSPNKICCSVNCSKINKLNKRVSKRIERKCIVCDTLFNTTEQNGKICCSLTCSKQHYNKQSKAYYYDVTKKKNGHLNRGESYPQKYIYNTIKSVFTKYVWKYNDKTVLKNSHTNRWLELDIWCPILNLAIEYDGEFHFHANLGEEKLKYRKNLDKLKDDICKENGIRLLRISNNDNWKDKDWLIMVVEKLIVKK